MHTVTFKSAIVTPPGNNSFNLEDPCIYTLVTLTIGFDETSTTFGTLEGDFQHLSRSTEEANEISLNCWLSNWGTQRQGITVLADTHNGLLVWPRHLPDLGFAVQMGVYAVREAAAGNMVPKQRLKGALVYGRAENGSVDFANVSVARGTIGVLRRFDSAFAEVFIGSPSAQLMADRFCSSVVHEVAKVADIPWALRSINDEADAELQGAEASQIMIRRFRNGERVFLLEGSFQAGINAVRKFVAALPPLNLHFALDVSEALSAHNGSHEYDLVKRVIPVRAPHHSVSTRTFTVEAQLAVHGVLLLHRPQDYVKPARAMIPSIGTAPARRCVIAITDEPLTDDVSVWGEPIQLENQHEVSE